MFRTRARVARRTCRASIAPVQAKASVVCSCLFLLDKNYASVIGRMIKFLQISAKSLRIFELRVLIKITRFFFDSSRVFRKKIGS